MLATGVVLAFVWLWFDYKTTDFSAWERRTR